MTAATAVVAESSEVGCVLIPLRQGQLLLPSVCVAEILPWRRIKLAEDGPDWYLGLLGWRGEAVPVVRFERLSRPDAETPAPGRCLVVMNRTGSHPGPTFYALVAEGLPRLVQLSEDDVADDDAQLGAAESRTVRLGAESAVIPELGYLEQAVARL